MSKWGVNDKKAAAKEREEQAKSLKQAKDAKAKADAEWKITDKQELRALEKKKEDEEKKQAEYERKQENKKIYEEDQAQMKSNKQATSTGKLTKAEIQKRQKQLLLKTLAKANPIKQQGASSDDEEEEKAEKYSFDSDDEDNKYKYKLKPNVNRLAQEQAEADQQNYDEVIDARGIDEALGALGDNQLDKHPEKRAKAAFMRYMEEQLVSLKSEYPTYKRSQLLEIIHKNWKKAPENPFNQTHLEFNEKKQ